MRWFVADTLSTDADTFSRPAPASRGGAGDAGGGDGAGLSWLMHGPRGVEVEDVVGVVSGSRMVWLRLVRLLLIAGVLLPRYVVH